jgi:hypothetical protein
MILSLAGAPLSSVMLSLRAIVVSDWVDTPLRLQMIPYLKKINNDWNKFPL